MTIEEAIIQLDYLKNFKTDWDIAICISRRKEKETLSRQEIIEGDVEKIREVMDCDADAEIKCKMIFSILFPHYFEKPEPMRDATTEERESVDKYVKNISKPTGVDFWNLEQGPDNRWCNTCEFKHLESECFGCAEYDEFDNLINLRNYKKGEE